MTDSPNMDEVLRNLKPVRPPRFASVRSIVALILREMSATYGRSPGGYIWAVLEPALGVALMAAIFSVGFRSPPLGTNFPIFYATGLLPFFLYINVSTAVAQAINQSRQLLNYPRVTFIDAILARFILATLTQLLVGYLLLTGILMVFETQTILNLPMILLAYSMAAVLALGVGLMNSVLMTRWAIWHTVWSVFNRPLVIVSNIIFLVDEIPEPFRSWLMWNPIVHIAGLMRHAFYYSYEAAYVDVMYVFLVALILGTIGLLFLRRYYRDFLEL
ncbi:ABC transporter permease [Histidinibacterium lentulum]|nr:ABC transporter permease [Histidinibacterium lentulum]